MNKILFLLGMVFCLDASARVVGVNENNSYSNEVRQPQVEDFEYADVIDIKQRFRKITTRGVCRQLDNSGRHICEQGELLQNDFIGFDITYRYKGYVGTFFSATHPGGRVLMKTVLTPVPFQ
jgi:hypothetical protein